MLTSVFVTAACGIFSAARRGVFHLTIPVSHLGSSAICEQCTQWGRTLHPGGLLLSKQSVSYWLKASRSPEDLANAQLSNQAENSPMEKWRSLGTVSS